MTMQHMTQKNEQGIEVSAFAQAIDTKCPYLGLKDDPATSLGFPDLGNHCYCGPQVFSIDTNKQSAFCLTSNHEICDIFQEELLRDRAADKLKRKIKNVRSLAIILPVILIIIAALIWWPAPGTSVEEATGHAAPLQNLVIPDVEEQPEVSQKLVVTKEKIKPFTQDTSKATIDAANVEPTPTPPADSAPDQPADSNSGGFHIRDYD